MSLQDLSPELLVLIMSAVYSPLDLHSLLSASPLCLAVFQVSRRTILSSVLVNSATPPVLHHLIAVLQAPTFADSRLPRPQHYHLVTSFLSSYFDGGTFQMPNEVSDIMRLHRLHSRVLYLIDRYFTDVSHRVQTWVELPRAQLRADSIIPITNTNMKNSGEQPSLKPFSETELVRLKRAVLRFELYCRLFPIDPYGNGSSHYSATEQFDLFISRLPPWQVEEMTSIHHYYGSIVEEVVARIGEDFVEAVHASPGLVQLDPGTEPSEEEDMEPFKYFDLTDMTFWSELESPSVPDFISYITSLGLGFIYSLTQADNAGQTKLIQHSSTVRRNFLPETLSESRGMGATIDVKKPQNIRGNDPTHANFGYWSFKRASEKSYLKVNKCGFVKWHLRGLGYVFWDSERFLTPGWPEMFKQSSRIECRDAIEYFTWRGRTFIEERLDGFWVPREEMRELEQRFGAAYELGQFPYEYDVMKD